MGILREPGDGPQTRARPAPAEVHGKLAEVKDFGANPGGLRLKVHAPAERPPKAAMVVVLHGCGQTPDTFEEGAGWRTLADRHGFVLIYPQQRRRNNGGGCFSWFSPTSRGGDEAASIHEMIRYAIGTYGVDPARVFVTGLSAGGAMAGILLATYPQMFAGGAILAGLPYGAARSMLEALGAMRRAPVKSADHWGQQVRRASSHQGRWPSISIWHGDRDETVDPANAAELVKQWTNLHGLDAGSAQAGAAPGYRREVWPDAKGYPSVELITLTGMGHGAPVAKVEALGAPAPFFLEAGISATAHLAQSWGLLAPAKPRNTRAAA